jgi:hypothetical protein
MPYDFHEMTISSLLSHSERYFHYNGLERINNIVDEFMIRLIREILIVMGLWLGKR